MNRRNFAPGDRMPPLKGSRAKARLIALAEALQALQGLGIACIESQRGLVVGDGASPVSKALPSRSSPSQGAARARDVIRHLLEHDIEVVLCLRVFSQIQLGISATHECTDGLVRHLLIANPNGGIEVVIGALRRTDKIVLAAAQGVEIAGDEIRSWLFRQGLRVEFNGPLMVVRTRGFFLPLT